MNKPITIKQLEKIMSQKTGLFDVNSDDFIKYKYSIDLLCSSVQFDKDMNDKSKCLSMILVCQSGELQIASNTIEVIFLDDDGTITLVFNTDLPELIIKYRE